MSFTVQNKIDLSNALGISLSALNYHLDAYSNDITSETETTALAYLDVYFEFKAKAHIEIEPNDPNFGAAIKFRQAMESAKKDIANTLQFDADEFGNGFQMRLVRG